MALSVCPTPRFWLVTAATESFTAVEGSIAKLSSFTQIPYAALAARPYVFTIPFKARYATFMVAC